MYLYSDLLGERGEMSVSDPVEKKNQWKRSVFQKWQLESG